MLNFDNTYEILTRDNEKWFLKYCWNIEKRHPSDSDSLFPAYSYIDKENKEKQEKIAFFTEYSWGNDPKLNFLSGWFSLNNMNLFPNVGERIIRKNLENNSTDEFVFNYDAQDDKLILKKISDPFIAWTVVELKDKLPLKNVLLLNFIAFVDYFWDKRTANLCKIGEESNLIQTTLFIARYINETAVTKPEYNELINRIKTYAIKNTNLQEKLDDFMTKLKNGSFIRIFQCIKNLLKVNKVELQNATFWEKTLAHSILVSEEMSSKIIDRAWNYVEEWNRLAKLKEIRESVMQFLLLLIAANIENDDPAAQEFNIEFWNRAFQSDVFPNPSIWFVAPQAPSYIQEVLINSIDQIHYLPKSKRELYSHLHFLSEASPTILDPYNRLRLILHNIEPIGKFELNNFYYFITRRIIRGITDNDLWLKCLPLFRRSEKLGFRENLADSFINQLFFNLDISTDKDHGNHDIPRDEILKEAINWILKYLKIENEYADSDFAESKNEREKENEERKPWKRYFFREFMINLLIDNVVEFFKLDSFYFLLKVNWFNPKNYGFGRQISLEMEREVTIALGKYYRNYSCFDENNSGEKIKKTKGEQMKNLIAKLLEKSDYYWELAFYIMYHTLPWDENTNIDARRQEKRVDKIFVPFLRQIYNNPRMKYLLNRPNARIFFNMSLYSKSPNKGNKQQHGHFRGKRH